MLSYLIFVLSAGFLLASVHPFIFYPASLKLLSRFYQRPLLSSSPVEPADARVALCLCAYNEQHVIHAKVENMLAMRRSIPNLDILIYVDAASDKTSEILAEFGDSIQVVRSPSRFGKTHGMNLLVQSTSADIIVFTDANVIFAEDALVNLLRPFGDASVGCALGHLHYVTEIRSATATTGSVYWNMEEKLKELESRTGSVITSDGAIFAIRRVLHQPPPPEVSDDIFISLSILCAGYRVVRVGDAVAYEKAVSSAAEEFNRKVRIACLAFTVHRMLWPQLQTLPMLDFYKYVSHKLLRWVTIYLLLAGTTLFLIGLLVTVGWLGAGCVAAAGIVATVVVWFSTRGPLGQVSSILQAFVATGIGVWNSLQGIRFQTWTPPASTRTQIAGTQHIASVDYGTQSNPAQIKN
jgi:cellulose synthase/poly-beta-1,6-N-acetylglucosamine synthase-like glycosyltransferase